MKDQKKNTSTKKSTRKTAEKRDVLSKKDKATFTRLLAGFIRTEINNLTEVLHSTLEFFEEVRSEKSLSDLRTQVQEIFHKKEAGDPSFRVTLSHYMAEEFEPDVYGLVEERISERKTGENGTLLALVEQTKNHTLDVIHANGIEDYSLDPVVCAREIRDYKVRKCFTEFLEADMSRPFYTILSALGFFAVYIKQDESKTSQWLELDPLCCPVLEDYGLFHTEWDGPRPETAPAALKLFFQKLDELVFQDILATSTDESLKELVVKARERSAEILRLAVPPAPNPTQETTGSPDPEPAPTTVRAVVRRFWKISAAGAAVVALIVAKLLYMLDGSMHHMTFGAALLILLIGFVSLIGYSFARATEPKPAAKAPEK